MKRTGIMRWLLGGLITAAWMALPWALGGEAWYAMPPLLAVAATVVAGVGSYLSTVVVAGLTVGNLIAIASTVYGVVSAKRAAKRAEASARAAYNAGLQDRMATLMGGEAPWQIVYGEAWAAPVAVADLLTSGDKDQFKHMVLIWAAHECEAIADFTLNGETVGPLDAAGWVTSGKWLKGNTQTQTVVRSLDAAAAATFAVPGATVVAVRPYITDEGNPGDGLDGSQVTVSGGVLQVNEPWRADWVGRNVTVTYNLSSGSALLRVRHHLGSPDQTADTALMADCPGRWTASDRLRGLCYSIVTYDLNEPEFQGGPLEARAKIRGKKLYDHRTGATAWSANNALVISDYLRGEHGKGALMTQLQLDSFIAAANVCDESQTVTLTRTDGGTEVVTGPRYTCNGVIRTDADPDSVLDELAQSMGGWMVRSGGLWSVQAGAFSAPVTTLGEADCMGAIETIQGEEGHEVFNGMRGQWWDPAQKTRTDYLPYQNTAFVAEDGGPIWAPLNLPFTNELWRCWQLARMLTERSRGETIVIPCKRRALKLRPGQRVLVNNSQLGMANAVFRVVKREYRLGGPVMLTMQQDAASVWDMADAQHSLPPTATTQPDPWLVSPVEGLTAESGNATLLQGADGTVLSRVRLSYSASQDIYVRSGGALQIEYRLDDEATWQRAPDASGTSQEAFLLGLQEGRVYVVRARWTNAVGAGSDWRSVVLLNLGKSAPASLVSGLVAEAVLGGLQISWDACPDVDYGRTEVCVGSTFATASKIWEGAANGYLWQPPGDGSYKIWVRHVDRSGNASTAPTSLTVSYVALLGATLTLQVDSQVFAVNKLGVPAPASVVFEAVLQSISGTPTFTVEAGTATLTGSGLTRTLTYSNMGSDTVRVRATLGTLSDVITVVKLFDGQDGVAGVRLMLSNEAHVLAATNTGVVSSYASATTQVRIWLGLVDDTANWTLAATPSSGVTASLSGTTLSVTNMTVDSGYVDVSATRSGYPTPPPVRFSVSKARAGATGSDGSPGTRTADPMVYKWALSLPASPSGTSTYTWATGALDAAPAGWTLAPGAPIAGYTLYGARVHLANTSTSATDTVNWTGATLLSIGSAGQAGQSARVAYTVKAYGAGLGSGTRTSTGPNSLPAFSAWGASETWTANVPSYGGSDVVWQTNGIYDPATNTITWDTPYISALKVGALSAITANLGSVTAGDITGVTITGGLLRTSASGMRIAINESGSNVARFYGDDGYGGVVMLAQIGALASGSTNYIGQFLGIASNGVLGESYGSGGVSGVIGRNKNTSYSAGPGVTGVSEFGYGVWGVSNSGGIGVMANGQLKSTGAFGCNNATPQTRYPIGGAATDLASALARINAIGTALINNGICST